MFTVLSGLRAETYLPVVAACVGSVFVWNVGCLRAETCLP
ncbi:hypothetical protein A2U01_0107459, partial [Trifolium medium]|nr:hypothetical protein [Trifolium medium]